MTTEKMLKACDSLHQYARAYRHVEGHVDDGFINYTMTEVYDELSRNYAEELYGDRLRAAREKAGDPLPEGEALTATWASIAARITKERDEYVAWDMGEDYAEGVCNVVLDEDNVEDNGDAFLVDLCKAGVI